MEWAAPKRFLCSPSKTGAKLRIRIVLAANLHTINRTLFHLDLNLEILFLFIILCFSRMGGLRRHGSCRRQFKINQVKDTQIIQFFPGAIDLIKIDNIAHFEGQLTNNDGFSGFFIAADSDFTDQSPISLRNRKFEVYQAFVGQ